MSAMIRKIYFILFYFLQTLLNSFTQRILLGVIYYPCLFCHISQCDNFFSGKEPFNFIWSIYCGTSLISFGFWDTYIRTATLQIIIKYIKFEDIISLTTVFISKTVFLKLLKKMPRDPPSHDWHRSLICIFRHENWKQIM